MHTCIHTYIHTYICLCIYLYRERERCVCVCIYDSSYYVYIYTICTHTYMSFYLSPGPPQIHTGPVHSIVYNPFIHACLSPRPGTRVAGPLYELIGRGQMGSALMGSLQISPKSARPYLFSPICQVHYFRSGPISVDPICPQSNYPSLVDASSGKFDVVIRVDESLRDMLEMLQEPT